MLKKYIISVMKIWGNQDKKTLGGIAPMEMIKTFYDLLKRFSSILGSKSGGGKGPSSGGVLIFHLVDFLVMDFLY
ncbi:MAG: hypothetical protein Ct9H90mP6_10440 [Gammaproteobacteria bacterium]|nr:MAG: hypothetical protein Ct9H90mP6_10440 [Gammaproteobacteria bacterium]